MENNNVTPDTVNELVSKIKEELHQKSASSKDEVRVMRTMLNDKTYSVGVYTNKGKVGEYSPYTDARKVVTNILSSGAKLSNDEATRVAEKYEFSKNDAAAFVGISKEFVNTYVRTGRKLPLGGREDMSVTLEIKEVPAGTKQYPLQGENKGKRGTVEIPAHNRLKASGACPSYIRNNLV